MLFVYGGCLGLALSSLAEPVPVYQQPSASVDARVEDLLSRMTKKEKLLQISAISLPQTRIVEAVSDLWMEKNLGLGVGSITGFQAGVEDDIAVRTKIRNFLKTRSRLGIPALFHDEAAHGLVKPGAVSYPAPIGMACSWDEVLIEKIYDRVAREVRSRGAQQVLAPVIDVNLDPRWGRTDETLGEDPYLNGRLGTAIVKGFQGGVSGEIDANHVMATLKHLGGHGAPEGGLNYSPAHIGPIELRETHVAPFAMIVRDAKPAAIMASYNEVDGVPSHANRELLRDLLRREYGFTGLFVSDYNGVVMLQKTHHLVETKAEAAQLALESGIQVEFPGQEAFSQLEPLLDNDAALAALVDDAVRAVLRMKFKLGLFEEPTLNVADARALATAPEARELALQAARESIVLLKNQDNLLPLVVDRYKRIAVIGPNADVARLGGYSGRPPQSVSLLDGLRVRVGDRIEILHAEGCKIVKNDAKDAYLNTLNITGLALADPVENRRLIAEAATVAEKADLVILAVGENEKIASEAMGLKKPGDRASLDLFGDQLELVHRIIATGKPVILFLSNGRPISLQEIADQVPVIIEGWYAGQETGRAAAEIIFGDTNPSGKLTISIPRSVGHIPAQYRRKPSAEKHTYLFDNATAAFPFGFGLSYTTFEYANLRVGKQRIARGENVQVTVDLTNTGKRAGTEVTQLYLSDEVCSVTRPIMELRGFQRVSLQPGETRTVTFEIKPDDLAFYNRELKRVVEPGWFTVMVGGSSVDTKKERFEVR